MDPELHALATYFDPLALKELGLLDTCELSRRVAKAMDASDPVLCKTLAYRMVRAFTLQWKRKKIGSEGIRKGVLVASGN